MARGFCTCKRDFPHRPEMTPPDNATWHFLCDKPVLPPAQHEANLINRQPRRTVVCASCFAGDWTQPHTCDGQPCFCFCNYADEAREAQRIAEVFDKARAEQDRGL